MATSTAHRAPPPPEASRLEKAVSLQGRLDAALAPEATAHERDALLYALSRPLPPEASPRERADFLLSLLADERLRALTGSGERTVGSAATQALLALGYPYALEIPLEALDPPAAARFLGNDRSLGKALIVANAVVPAGFFTLLILGLGSQGDLPLIPISFLALSACTLLPLFLILKGRKKKSLVLQDLGSAGLILSGFTVGALCLPVFLQQANSNLRTWGEVAVFTLLTGGLLFNVTQIVGTYLLHARKE